MASDLTFSWFESESNETLNKIYFGLCFVSDKLTYQEKFSEVELSEYPIVVTTINYIMN